MAFREFMESEDFKDYHNFYVCSRNNLYNFSQSKFESTLEYFKHLKQINDININECKEIFEKYDIPTVPSPKIRFYSYTYFEQQSTQPNDFLNNSNDSTTIETIDFSSSDEENVKQPTHIIKMIEGNIPIIFRNNIKNKAQNLEEDLEYENDSTYEFFSCEENDSDNSEQEEIF